MPAPYRLRTYQPGDEALWAELVRVGMPSHHTAETCRTQVVASPYFDPAGFFLVVQGEQAVGTACAFQRDGDPPHLGCVHMVCVHPDHRGHRLGYWVTLAVLHRLRERGFRQAVLQTDDWRLPAIRIYRDLGFQPYHTHASHPERWQKVFAQMEVYAQATGGST